MGGSSILLVDGGWGMATVLAMSGAGVIGVGTSLGAVEMGVGAGALVMGVSGTGAVGLLSAGAGTTGMGPVLRLSRGDGAGVMETGVGDVDAVALSAEIGTVVADEVGGVNRAAPKGTVVVGDGTTGTEPVGGLRAVPFSTAGGVPAAEGMEPVGGREPNVGG
jgi:hypothetical protein